MRAFQFVFLFALSLAMAWGLSSEIAPLPFGKFFDPFQGFWANAEQAPFEGIDSQEFSELAAPAKVYYDDRRVPHIFAENDHDLYFLQGYVTAQHRLWQMDFQVRVAAGRLSEVFGDNPRVIKLDRKQRRFGLAYGAQNTMELLSKKPEDKAIFDAYSEGVNAYINQLSPANLPLEYKLLGYEPEQWNPYKCALVTKLMANDLAGRTEDLGNTNAWRYFGEEWYDVIFPKFPSTVDPIIPAGTPFDFEAVALDTPETFIPDGEFGDLNFPDDINPHNGSNNWAVSGKKTASGNPILASDPHLRLTLPSIWYEVQLHSPTCNSYGVSIPGGPFVIIGFNENIAWGITNSGRDVVDWYNIEFKDASKKEYKYDGGWKATEQKVEEIKIKGKASLMDTVYYTHHGPVMYDETYTKSGYPTGLACQWTAHNGSNEMMTFYGFNRAKNHADYIEALNYYESPGQNFAFAARDGDIAIKQQGKFPAKWPGQGRFIMDGSNPLHEWQAYIPADQNPHIKNPERGFISSANQHPTDSTYPYDILSQRNYEYQRNRRINQELTRMENITAEEMMKLQNDNFNMLASEVVPFFLEKIDKAALNKKEKEVLADIAAWNFFNETNLTAPSVYEEWSRKVNKSIWSDDMEGPPKLAPSPYITLLRLKEFPDFPYVDDIRTPEKEILEDFITNGFKESVAELISWKDSTGMDWKWVDYKGTTLSHYIPTLTAFHSDPLPIGGNYSIVNAASKAHGPSWRMVVELGDKVTAHGNYPGGQSGNPGSANYLGQAEDWAKGRYYELNFYSEAPESEGTISHSQTFNTKK